MKRHLLPALDNVIRRLKDVIRSLCEIKPRQASIRLFLGAPLLSLVLLTSYGQGPDTSLTVILSVTAALFLLSLAMLLAELRAPSFSRTRYYSGLVVDTSALTGVLLLGGAPASPLWLGYLWILANYSSRNGGQNPGLPAIFSLTGFSSVLVASEYWAENRLLGFSLLIFLLGASNYFSRRLSIESIPPRRDASPASVSEQSPNLAAIQPQLAFMERWSRTKRQALNGKKILLLSNDRDQQQTIKRHLDSWGATAELCSNVTRSFAALVTASEQTEPFHALIAVQGQFDMDPLQLAHCVRADPALQTLALIHIGATPEGALSDQLRAAGYYRLLDKPLDKTLLFEALHDIDDTPLGEASRVVKLLDHYAGRKSRQPLSILLADVSTNDLRRNKRILQQAGHHVFVVDNGLRILDALESHSFDIAVVNMQLQELTGLEAFKLFRFTRTDRAWVPFIILLDQVSAVRANECEDAGINAVLMKPVVSSQLTETVEKVVQASVQDKIRKGSSFDTGAKLTRAIVIDGLTLDGQRLKELDQLGKGENFLADLISNFGMDSAHTLDLMEQAINSSDLTRFQDLGHTLKDSAGSLGTLELFQLGVRATRLHATDFPDAAQRLLEQLRRCCRDSHKALRHYLASREQFINLRE